MKQKFYLILAGLFLLTLQLKAQAPNSLNYQGVARGSSGEVLPNQTIKLRFTIHEGSESGTGVYQETQLVQTNSLGLFSLPIGAGTIISGNFSTIAWGNDPYYMQVELDPQGTGSTYINMGTTQLLSVPYALYAQNSGSGVAELAAATPLKLSGSSRNPSITLSGTAGAVPYGTGAGSAFNTAGSVGQVLVSGGTGAPTWGSANAALTTKSIVPGSGSSVVVTNGTNQIVGTSNLDIDVQGTAANKGGIFYSTGVGTAAAFTAKGSAGQILQSNGTGAPTWVTPAVTGWGLTGNTGTTYTQNYLGTTDDNGLQFEVNGQEAGLIEDYDYGNGGEANTALGYQALLNNHNNGGYENTGVGFNSLYYNGGGDNTAIGYNASYNSQYTYQNVAVGSGAMYSNYSTSNNTAIGYQASYQNDQYYEGEANNNTSVGAQALFSDIDAYQNTAVGYQALYNNDNDDGQQATNNTAIGYGALTNDVDGNSNTAIGANANLSYYDQGNPLNNSTAIGANASVSTSNTVQLGSGCSVQFDQALMPAGNAGAAGQVLQSNGGGSAPTWVTLSGSGTPGWNLAGNTGTIYGTNFIGTTDDNGLQFEVNSSEAGLIEDNDGGSGGSANTALGYQALQTNLSSAIDNTAVGYQALQNTSGSGWYNAATGFQAMVANTSGQWNAAYGTLALTANQTGQKNTAVGSPAMYGNTTGSFNTAIGTNALNSNQTGTQITALGYLADVGADGLNDATAIGANAIVSTSNTIVLGDNNVVEFDFNGSLTPWNGSSYDPGTAGYVLQSNGAGMPPTWVAPSGGGGGSGWGLTGNAGTNYGTNFIGTTDEEGLQFEVNSNEAGRVEDNNSGGSGGSANTSLGYGTLQNIAGGSNNVAMGWQAQLSNQTGSQNIAFGVDAEYSNTSGSENIAIGEESSVFNTGSQNISIGGFSMYDAGTGGNNVAIGFATLYHNQGANNNTFVGFEAGSATQGVSGDNNVALGASALNNITSGIENVAIGANSLPTNQTGSDLTVLGTNADVSTDGLTNSIALGAGAVITMSNQLIIPATVTHVNMSGIPVFADDAAAGTGGLVKGDMYQTDGTDPAPLNVPGILMIKQ